MIWREARGIFSASRNAQGYDAVQVPYGQTPPSYASIHTHANRVTER